MKFYIAAILFLACAVHFSLADWKDDIKKTRLNKMDSFITKQQQILMNNAMIHNTPGAWACVNSATSQLMNLMRVHRAKIDQCINPATNEAEANSCCDRVDHDIISQVSVICNNTFVCIMQS